jgi:hypothetical protein
MVQRVQLVIKVELEQLEQMVKVASKVELEQQVKMAI